MSSIEVRTDLTFEDISTTWAEHLDIRPQNGKIHKPVRCYTSKAGFISGLNSLEVVIKRTEEELGIIEDLGVGITWPEWSLMRYPLKAERTRRAKSAVARQRLTKVFKSLIPPGYFLIATVDNVLAEERTPESVREANHILGQSGDYARTRSGKLALVDHGPHQVIYGRPEGSLDSAANWFVDVEPILLKMRQA